MLGQDRHLAGDQRQLPVHLAVEGELDLAVADLLGLDDVGVVGAVERVALGLEGLEGPDHVLDRDRRAVLPARLGPQREDHPGAILRHLDALGDQAVFRERLVQVADRQGVEQQSEAGGIVALEDELVEIVEGADRRQGQRAAFGRVRVSVVEMGEVGAVFELAVHRRAMPRLRRLVGPAEAASAGARRPWRASQGDMDRRRGIMSLFLDQRMCNLAWLYRGRAATDPRSVTND